jgi:pimeloyl-ACP methyl ester carboxylesterase
MRRWIKRLVIAGTVGLVLSLAIGISYEQWSRAAVQRALPPPGELVDIGGVRLHLHCSGEGSPTVILEAGTGPPASIVWTDVQPSIAEFARVCSYDRAGLMWSDQASAPRDSRRIATELHALLSAADVPPPFVLVGHSIGGVHIRVFANRFPDEVAGLVFVDSSHPDQKRRFPPELRRPMRAPAQARFLGPLLAQTGILRLSGGLALGKLPPDVAAVTNAYLPHSVPTLLAEYEAQGESMSQATEAGALNSLPLIVLSAGRDAETPLQAQFRAVWAELQEELAALSSNADHRVVEDSGHFIQFDAPEAVIAAVRDVVMAAKTESSVSEASGRANLKESKKPAIP